MTVTSTIPAASETTTETRPAVLYIDDDASVAKVMGRIIGKCGFTVTVEQDAERALRDLQSGLHAPSIVLTDLDMPRMTGYQVAMAVRRICPDVPVVLITGALGDEDVEGRSAVADVLLKPCRMQDVSRILHGVLA